MKKIQLDEAAIDSMPLDIAQFALRAGEQAFANTSDCYDIMNKRIGTLWVLIISLMCLGSVIPLEMGTRIVFSVGFSVTLALLAFAYRTANVPLPGNSPSILMQKSIHQGKLHVLVTKMGIAYSDRIAEYKQINSRKGRFLDFAQITLACTALIAVLSSCIVQMWY